MLLPDDIDEKTRETVEDVLRSKHPDAHSPENLPHCDTTPEFIDVPTSENTIEQVAAQLSGSHQPFRVNAHALQQWLLRFGQTISLLQQAAAKFTTWLSNSTPPWAACHAPMSGQLITTVKCPRVCPIGIGKVQRHLFSKCIIAISKLEAKDSGGADQLHAGLESGVEGVIHAMNHLWEVHKTEEEWEFFSKLM